MRFANIKRLVSSPLVLVASVQPSPNIDVTLIVDGVAVQLGVNHHFSDSARELPAPGRLRVDAHDKKHGAVTYCYGFSTREGPAQLELYDSDFGMHTARILRVPRLNALCPPLRSPPHFIVSGERFSLLNREFAAPPGFDSDRKDHVETFKREWTYSVESGPSLSGGCFSRSVDVTIDGSDDITRSVTVQNWEEPGC
jgi:hypothetical protein